MVQMNQEHWNRLTLSERLRWTHEGPLSERLGWTHTDRVYADAQGWKLHDAIIGPYCYITHARSVVPRASIQGARWTDTSANYYPTRERVRKLADDGDLVALKAWAIEIRSKMECGHVAVKD
jgi:hypothetical protein